MATPFSGIRPRRSKGFDALNIVRECCQALLAAYGRNWTGSADGHSKDSSVHAAFGKDPCQSGGEDQKGWFFEEVRVAYSCPPLLSYGQESLRHISGEVREGTPIPYLTYLADFTSFFHQLS